MTERTPTHERYSGATRNWKQWLCLTYNIMWTIAGPSRSSCTTCASRSYSQRDVLSAQVTEVWPLQKVYMVHAVWDRNFVMRWIVLARVYVECGWRFWFWWTVHHQLSCRGPRTYARQASQTMSTGQTEQLDAEQHRDAVGRLRS